MRNKNIAYRIFREEPRNPKTDESCRRWTFVEPSLVEKVEIHDDDYGRYGVLQQSANKRQRAGAVDVAEDAAGQREQHNRQPTASDSPEKRRRYEFNDRVAAIRSIQVEETRQERAAASSRGRPAERARKEPR